ncbi:hypothetical protein BH23GEM1_BH23GEM1_00490 [soil metagenome]
MRVLARVAAVALLGWTAACSDGGVNEPQTVAGTYTLQSVNGAPLPYVFFEGEGYKLEVTAGNYVLAAGGTFSSSVTFRETENGVATTSSETFSGRYAVSGSVITFTYSDGDVITGTISGNTLQFTEDGETAVFVR